MEYKIKEFISSNDINNQLLNLWQLTFEVTDSCNLNCKYCAYGEFYDDYDKRNTTNLPFNKALLLLEYLKSIWLSNRSVTTYKNTFISFYGGEPLMNFDFIQKVIEYISDLKIPDRQFVFSMTTNGLIINKYIDFLAAKDVQLLISLDGDRDNHSYRVDHSGNNSYDKVVKNIEIINQRYPKYYNNKVNFNAVLHNRNAVEDIFSFIKKKFGRAPMISELNPTGLRKEKVELFWQTYKNKTESIESSDNYLKLQKEMFLETPRTRELALFIHRYSGNVFNTYNDLLIDENHKRKIPTGTCLPFGKKCL